MAEHKQTFAMDIINEAMKQRNRWRLAAVISIVLNIIQAAVLIFG